MSQPSPSREEFEARIAAAEARADARFIAFEKRVDESMGRIELNLSPLQNVKAHTWAAAAAIIGSVVTVVAVYVAAFDSGRETATLAAETQRQIDAVMAETQRQQAELRRLLNEKTPDVSQTKQP